MTLFLNRIQKVEDGIIWDFFMSYDISELMK